jgi:hypothetical protein
LQEHLEIAPYPLVITNIFIYNNYNKFLTQVLFFRVICATEIIGGTAVPEKKKVEIALSAFSV